MNPEVQKAAEEIKQLILSNSTIKGNNADVYIQQDDLTRICVTIAGAQWQSQQSADEDQGKNWNRVVAIVATADICKNNVPGDNEGLDNWKIEVISRLSKEFHITLK